MISKREKFSRTSLVTILTAPTAWQFCIWSLLEECTSTPNWVLPVITMVSTQVTVMMQIWDTFKIVFLAPWTLKMLVFDMLIFIDFQLQSSNYMNLFVNESNVFCALRCRDTSVSAFVRIHLKCTCQVGIYITHIILTWSSSFCLPGIYFYKGWAKNKHWFAGIHPSVWFLLGQFIINEYCFIFQRNNISLLASYTQPHEKKVLLCE